MPESRCTMRLGQGNNNPQGAQKGQTSHPPNPGAPRRALSQTRPQRVTKDRPSKLARVRCPQDGSDESPAARNVFTRPPTGTPRRALSPGEGLQFAKPLFREWPRLPFTARIEGAQFHRARSASKKGTWPLPSHPLRPRVARARGTHRAIPLCWRTFSASC